MSSPISGAVPVVRPPSEFSSQVAAINTSPGQIDFQQLLMDSLSQTSQLEHQAQANIETRMLGGDITSAEVYTSLKKADMALKMMLQVRNKLVSAFQEVQQMRI